MTSHSKRMYEEPEVLVGKQAIARYMGISYFQMRSKGIDVKMEEAGILFEKNPGHGMNVKFTFKRLVLAWLICNPKIARPPNRKPRKPMEGVTHA